MAFFGPGLTSQQQNIYGQTNQGAQNLLGQAGGIYNQIDPALMSILANPGYTPAQISSMTTGALQPISSGFSSAAANLGKIGRQTGGNTAGIVSGQDQLARQAAAAIGPASANLQTQIADRPRQQTFQALQGLQNLYNPTLTEAGNLYNTSANIANNPRSPSVMSDIGSIFGLAGDAAGAASGLSSLFTPAPSAVGLSNVAAGVGGGVAGYATGGKVKKKKPILVGEQGPEIFKPSSNGKIIPNPNTVRQMENIYG